MHNKIKALRSKNGISQRELAKRVGTSQQQIQRLETGQVAARVELARKLSDSLGVPLSVLFPGSKKALGKFSKGIKEEPRYLPSNEAYDELAQTGIEADPRLWTFFVLLRSHKKVIKFELEPAEKRRLFRLVQEEKEAAETMSFVLFDTIDERVAINLRELAYCHFLFDAPSNSVRTEESSMLRVMAYLCGNHEPFEFGVEPDFDSPDEEDDSGAFRNIFFYMETHVEEHDRFYFVDEDGEDVFLRAGDLALLRVPLWVISADMDEEEDEGDDDEEDLVVDELATTTNS